MILLKYTLNIHNGIGTISKLLDWNIIPCNTHTTVLVSFWYYQCNIFLLIVDVGIFPTYYITYKWIIFHFTLDEINKQYLSLNIAGYIMYNINIKIYNVSEQLYQQLNVFKIR